MMRQATTWADGKSAPGQIPTASLGGSFLVAVPFRASRSADRHRRPEAKAPEAKTDPSGIRTRTAIRRPWHAQSEPTVATITVVVMQSPSTFTETVYTTADFPPSVTAPVGDDSESELLQRVVRYLDCRARRETPDDVEREAWQQFYDRYDPLIRRVVRYSLGNRTLDIDPDDCAQEVWAELITKLGRSSYDPRRGHFSSWLHTFVRRKVIRLVRSRARHSTQSLPDPAATIADDDCGPQACYQRQENRDFVHRMLAVLEGRVSDVNHRILQLRWIEDRPASEIAAAVDISPDQVRYRLSRMKRKLRALMDVHSPDAAS